MTWTKLGSEFFPECLHHGLPDSAVRTHAEAIAYLYEVEEMSCRIPKRLVRTFAGSEDYLAAIDVLLALEWWVEAGADYEVMHHGDVIRQSIAAQLKQRERTKKSSRTYRQRNAENTSDGTTDVTADVTGHVTHHADRQTDKQLGAGVSSVCEHGIPNGHKPEPWSEIGALICDHCEEARRSA